ncbi:MAG: hypothetical protein MO847_08675, partial [Candidatus Protistobacter heckmanni]|nr:hypothetical protein [Candidatus Protistobacter heckmanni]
KILVFQSKTSVFPASRSFGPRPDEMGDWYGHALHDAFGGAFLPRDLPLKTSTYAARARMLKAT